MNCSPLETLLVLCSDIWLSESHLISEQSTSSVSRGKQLRNMAWPSWGLLISQWIHRANVILVKYFAFIWIKQLDLRLRSHAYLWQKNPCKICDTFSLSRGLKNRHLYKLQGWFLLNILGYIYARNSHGFCCRRHADSALESMWIFTVWMRPKKGGLDRHLSFANLCNHRMQSGILPILDTH